MEKEHKKHKHEHNNQERHEEKKCNCEKTCECQDEKRECKHDKVEERQTEEIEKLRNQLTEILNEKQSLLEKLQYSKAEMINYRKRKDEEVSRMMKFCNEDIIKDLLPVADNFERALLLAEDNTNEEFVKFIEGYKMIYCSLQNILSKFDVKAIDGANKPFDPVYHNAVLMETKEGIEPGMVLEVLQKGYLYKDKVIRPAMVKVSE